MQEVSINLSYINNLWQAMSYVTIDLCQLENYFTIRGNIIMILNKNKNNNNNNNKGVFLEMLVAAKSHKNDPND